MTRSEYVKLLEEISEAIVKDKSGTFEKIPVYYDMVELTPHSLPPTCIAFDGKPFGWDKSNCLLERQLNIVILHSTRNKRQITERLSAYAEQLLLILREVDLPSGSELTVLQGSEIGYLENAKKDSESYKSTKTLLTSFIVVSCLVRY